MWRLEIKPAALAWLLSIMLLVGLGVRVYERMSNRLDLPLIVTRDGTALTRARMDSMLAVRAARRSAPVNINTATAKELERLSGIGPSIAKRIVEYRDQHGPFHSVDDLDAVSGIGPKRLDVIRHECVIDSP